MRLKTHLSGDPSLEIVLELLSAFLSSLDAVVASSGNDVCSDGTRRRERISFTTSQNEKEDEKRVETNLGTSVARSSSQTPMTPTSATSS